ncbi:MAG: 50S ribosomal protein L23 [Gammaproteobacteria bacterium]|nr:50S ribosomal protein L23 [Gammaproteobacteria bacterium]MDH3432533.1 50S ribosomal protein L23 [Gammaproteobacteria bacterium]
MSAAAHQERLMTVLQGPVLSEKSTLAAEKNNQIVFKVRTDATKAEIRAAVELLFEVKVEGVQVLNNRGKTKRFGQTRGRRDDWKKAYVRLAEGSQIDFLGTE